MDDARTYTLDDLESWPRIHAGVSLAVLGHPIKHSISPAMHNAALADCALTDNRFLNWRYFRFDVRPEDLPRALELFLLAGFKGLNLTVPHKVIAYDLVNTAGTSARGIGAVNTLVADEGTWLGYNTDGYGLAEGIREDLGMELGGAHVILLGAGGAARGAAVECLERRCASLWIANRTRENLDTLLDQLAPLAGGVAVRGFDPTRAAEAGLPAGALVINATSAGLKPSDSLPVDLATLPRPCAIYDMIYNPWETALLKRARDLEINAANGLSMLVHQGAEALSLWRGKALGSLTGHAGVDSHVMQAAARAAMRR